MINYSKSLIFIMTISLIFISFLFNKEFKRNKSDQFRNSDIKDNNLKLESCVDIKNKTKRKLHENIELLEYCVKNINFQK